jgi:tetratricopeptide (TPR) repeat protein
LRDMASSDRSKIKPIFRTGLIVGLLFCLAFSLRLLHVQDRKQLPDFARPTMDSKYHDEWAWGLASGNWDADIVSVRTDPYFRAPLYPYCLAGLYRVLGRDYHAARLVLALIGAATVVLLFFITIRLFGRRAAILAGLLYIGYWPMTYYSGELLIPVVAIALDLTMILVLLVAAGKRSKVLWALAGTILGMSAIARPNVLLVAPFLGFWIWRVVRSATYGPSPWRSLLAFYLASLAVVVPVTFRNAIVGGDFVPIASQGGVNFYIGNNPEADGVKAIAPGTRGNWWGGFEDTRQLAEAELGRELKPSQISRYWYGRGLKFWADHPVGTAKLYFRKLVLLFGNAEISNNRQVYFMRSRSRVLRSLPINFSVLFAFAALGVIGVLQIRSSRKDDCNKVNRCERLLPLYFAVPYAASVLLFFVTSRHRLPVCATLLPFAGWGMSLVWAAVGRRQWTTVVRRVALVATIGLATVLNPFNVGGLAGARGLYDLGVDYADVDPARASAALDESIMLDPSYAPAWKVRGQMKYELGNIAGALTDLKTATRLDSSFTTAFYFLGLICQKTGNHEEAIAPYKRVLRIDPDDVPALVNLADVYMRRGDHEISYQLLCRAARLEPEYPNTIFGLGQYYEAIGEYPNAISQYDRILDWPVARFRLLLVRLKQGDIEAAYALVERFESQSGISEETAGFRRLLELYASHDTTGRALVIRDTIPPESSD